MTAGPSGLVLEFCTDAADFLAAAGDHLAADAVVSTVVTTVAHRVLAQRETATAQPDRDWWLVVRDASGAGGGRGAAGGGGGAGLPPAPSPPPPAVPAADARRSGGGAGHRDRRPRRA